MSGFPVFPSVEFDLASTEHSSFTWYRCKPAEEDSSNSKDEDVLSSPEHWSEIGEGFTISPTNEDVGSRIVCRCTPGNESRRSEFHETSIVSKQPISAGPGHVIADAKTAYTKKFLDNPNQLRVVTYNILADVFATMEFARNNFYPYCSDYALDFYYRRQLILKELLEYHADVICLQECEEKMFQGYLRPALSSAGYDSLLTLKLGENPEGAAMFTRTSKLTRISEHSVNLRECVRLPCNREVFEKMAKFPALGNGFDAQKQIAQVCLFKVNNSSHQLLIINTHLYYKPTAGDIKLLQTVAICAYAHALFQAQLVPTSVLFCGDLNSMKDSAVLRYLEGNIIGPQDDVWMNKLSSETGFCMTLRNPLKLINASGYPPFTNFTPNFKATLDHIFISGWDMSALSSLPQPPEEELAVYEGLPCIVAPSDHLSVVCEVQWKEA